LLGQVTETLANFIISLYSVRPGQARLHIQVPDEVLPVWLRTGKRIRPRNKVLRFFGDLGNRDELFTFAIAGLTAILAGIIVAIPSKRYLSAGP
jgi:hypothetical protein